jgi:hypothetical protein
LRCVRCRFLFFGQYELLPKAVHESATCQLRFAIHHKEDEKIDVALKFMKEKSQFRRSGVWPFFASQCPL